MVVTKTTKTTIEAKNPENGYIRKFTKKGEVFGDKSRYEYLTVWTEETFNKYIENKKLRVETIDKKNKIVNFIKDLSDNFDLNKLDLLTKIENLIGEYTSKNQ